MRRLYQLFSISLLALLQSACVSGPKMPSQIINDAFLMDIKDDDSKLFIYFANFKGGKVRQRSTPTRVIVEQAPRKSASALRSDLAERYERLAIKAINFKLQDNGYCRTGYFILNSYVEFGSVEIRAECKESATQADRDLFL